MAEDRARDNAKVRLSKREAPARSGSRLAGCALLGFLAVALGCHSRADAEARPVGPPSDGSVLGAPVVLASAPAPRPPPRLSTRTIASGGQARRYLLVVPGAIDPARRYPLVLYFHGDGGDGEGMHRAAPFESASGDDALVAYPDGIGHTWDLETPRDNRDVAFVEALINDVATLFTVDRSRVFAAGYSNGGFFANVLACQKSQLVRAIASSAGGAPYNQSERWPNLFPKCPGEAPVAALALHGEDDNGVTLDSGRFSAEYWAYVNGCNMREMEATAYPECRAYRGCPVGKQVAFCKVPGLGHWVWDRAAAVSWQFFLGAGPSSGR